MNRIPCVSVAALHPPTNCKKLLQNSATSQKCLCKQTPSMAICMTWHQHLVNHPQAFADGTFSRGPQAHWGEREGEEEKGVTEEKMTRVTEVLEPHKMLQMLSSTQIMMNGYNYWDTNVILDLFVPTVYWQDEQICALNIFHKLPYSENYMCIYILLK